MNRLDFITIISVVIYYEIKGIVGENCREGTNESLENLCFSLNYSIIEPPDPPIVSFTFFETEIIHIDILKQIITTSIGYYIVWPENRIEFSESFQGKTIIVTKEMDKFWIPNLRILNLVNTRLHSFLGRGDSNVVWVEKPNWSKMSVAYASIMKVETWCEMDFERFPFDHQECFINVCIQ